MPWTMQGRYVRMARWNPTYEQWRTEWHMVGSEAFDKLGRSLHWFYVFSGLGRSLYNESGRFSFGYRT
jgi:hypothetical protein